jgi:hypothetical protein
MKSRSTKVIKCIVFLQRHLNKAIVILFFVIFVESKTVSLLQAYTMTCNLGISQWNIE